jgi:glycosyltransferase involved in cell wall biosynthesis
MRLAIVTHNVIRGDGQGRTNYEVALHALRRGDQVFLVADQVDQDLVEKGAVWLPIQPGKLRRVNLFKVWEFAVRANRLLKARAGDFDIIHGTGFCLDRPHHVNTAQFVHSAWLQNPAHPARGERGPGPTYQWLYSTLNARWERNAFGHARQVTAVSRTVEGELRRFGFKGGNGTVKVIPNGVDVDEFKPGPADRAALGLPTDGAPLALFAGDIRTPRKNLDTVLKALVDVPRVRLAVVGGADRSPYPAMAEQLGLKDRVHFLGFRKDMAAIMRAVDVFVFPSRYEPFGMVVAEAMASGVPVITAASTGASEYVTPDCGVILADSDDAAGLAKALKDITGDEDRRRAMAEAAHRQAQGLNWDSISRAYFDIYESCRAAN